MEALILIRISSVTKSKPHPLIALFKLNILKILNFYYSTSERWLKYIIVKTVDSCALRVMVSLQ